MCTCQLLEFHHTKTNIFFFLHQMSLAEFLYSGTHRTGQVPYYQIHQIIRHHLNYTASPHRMCTSQFFFLISSLKNLAFFKYHMPTHGFPLGTCCYAPLIQCVRKVAVHLGYGTIQMKCDGT